MRFLRWNRTFRSSGIPKRFRDQLNDRQQKVEGYALEPYQHARIVIVGLGGLGMPIADGLMRKGARFLDLFDDDRVELSNRTRQQFGYGDIGKYKVHAAGKQLAQGALFPPHRRRPSAPLPGVPLIRAPTKTPS